METKNKFERPKKFTKYKLLEHINGPKQSNTENLLYKAIERYKIDGLYSVNYKLSNIVKYKMFTHLLINVGEPL